MSAEHFDGIGARPDAFLPDLASSLNNLGGDLSNLGRREEALAASQEAVDIRMRLAATRSDAFLPDLASSLGAHSSVLAALDRHHEAARMVADALRIILPYAERYRELTRTITADVLRYNDAAGQAPDQALLERAAQALAPSGEEQAERRS